MGIKSIMGYELPVSSSSGGVMDWKLLIDETITESVNYIKFTEDIEGNPLRYENFIVYIENAKSENGLSYTSYIRGTGVAAGLEFKNSIRNNNTFRVVAYRTQKLIDDINMPEMVNAHSEHADRYDSTLGFKKINEVFEYYTNSTTNLIPVGTKIKLYSC